MKAYNSGTMLRVLLRTFALVVPACALYRDNGIYRPGDFNISGVSFMDCTGPMFDPIWDRWHKLVVDWDRGMYRAGALNIPPQQVEGLEETGIALSEVAHELLSGWFHHLQKASGQSLDMVFHFKIKPEDLNGVCYYGIVQALWARAQLLLLQPHDSRTASEAVMELKTAVDLLGSDNRANYLDSTRWTVRMEEIRETIKEKKIVRHSSTQISVKGALQAVDHTISQSYFASPLHDFYEMDLKPPTAGLGLVNVAAFGQHLSLTAEMAVMIRGSLYEWKVVIYWFISQCRWQDPMHHYMCRLACQLIHECHYYEDSENMARRLLKYIAYVAEEYEGLPEDDLKNYSSVERLLDLTAELWQSDANLRSSHLIVCTVPLLCVLLRAVCPLPILGYFAMTSYTRAHPGFGTWGIMLMAEMMKNTVQNAIAFPFVGIRDGMVWEVSVKPPLVRPWGLYSIQAEVEGLWPNVFAQFLKGTASHPNSVVVARSRYNQGTSFFKVMKFFLDAVTPTWPLNFTVIRTSAAGSGDVNLARNPHPGGERLGALLNRDDNVFVESAAFRRYRCAILLPQAAHMFSTIEMHSLHLPVFIPTRELRNRLQEFSSKIHSAPPKFPRIISDVVRPMKPAFVKGNPWPSNDPIWQHLGYVRCFGVHLPGVRMFRNFPDLLHQLLYTDFAKVREDMRKENEIEFAKTVKWYRNAVLHLLSRPPHFFIRF